MARKRRLPFDCFACGKCFKSAQAVRGHCRHCRDARLTRQAQAEAAALPGTPATQRSNDTIARERLRSSQSGEADCSRRRPGPLSYDFKIVLLDAEDAIHQLHGTAEHFAYCAEVLARMNAAGMDARAQAWEEIRQVLDNYLRDLEPMLALFRLDRGALARIYNSMRRLKERWLIQRMAGYRFVETEPDGLDLETRKMLHEDEARLTRIIELLKRLVAAAP